MLFADLRFQMLHSLSGAAHLPQQLNVITGHGLIEFFLVTFYHDGLADRRISFFIGHFKVGADGLARVVVVR